MLFVFLLVMRVITWLRLSRREDAQKTAEILLLRHEVTVLQRHQPHRPKLNWADPALLATLFGVIPKARRQELRLLITPDTIVRWRRDILQRRWAARSMRGRSGRPVTRRNIKALVLRLTRETPNGGTAGPMGGWPTWGPRSRRRPYARSSRRTAPAPPGGRTGPTWVPVPALPGRRDPGERLLHGRPARRQQGHVLADAGIRTVLCKRRTPRMNAIAERWIGGCRRELLDRTLTWNQDHPRRILSEYETHHNQHRPHRSLNGAAPLKPLPEPVNLDHCRVRRQTRADDTISEYRLVT